MKNRDSNMKKTVISILLAPFTLLSNIKRVLKLSIRSKISFNYIMLYILVCFLIGMTAISGYFYYLSNEYRYESYIYLNEVIALLQDFEDIEVEEIDTKELIQKEKAIKDIMAGTNIEMIIQDQNSQNLTQTSDKDFYNNFQYIKNRNFIYRNIPITLSINYGRLPIIQDINIGKNIFTIIFFYRIDEYLQHLAVILALIIIAMFIGMWIILFFGSWGSRKVLRPIKQMTKDAQAINVSNLDMRIDVGESKFELKDLALTMNAMMDRIEDSYLKQQQFVSDVSHELRTPISVIDGYANMLNRWGKNNPEILEESIEAIKNESENMRDLVEKLLFLARHDKNTLKYEFKKVNISELLEEIIKETTMIDKDHEIVKNIEKNILLNGDANRIKQAVRIFVDNAIKYTPLGGEITISAESENNNVVISIKDSGLGISQNDLRKIFHRFYRADKSRTKETGGHGLGLSIAKIIILGHDGKIRVKSKLEEGSEFIINLPTKLQ